MINPSEVDRPGKMVRLRILESIWIQGKLRMRRRWSYIDGDSGGDMSNQLLAPGRVTKTTTSEALRRMRRAGISKLRLEVYLREILNSENKGGVALCSDEKGLLANGAVASVLMNGDYRSLYSVIVGRHHLRRSKLQMANGLKAKYPD